MVWEHSIYLYTLLIIPLLVLAMWFKVRSLHQRAAYHFEADQKNDFNSGTHLLVLPLSMLYSYWG